MPKNEVDTFCPSSRSDWRAWLAKNHQSEQAVWLVYYKKSSQKPSLTWSEAVDEALCFGWIDSTKKGIDDERYMQYFCKRKPSSTWSKINKEKIVQLTQNGLMRKAGLESIKVAKENGTWSILDDVENLVIPEALKLALDNHKGAMAFFEKQSKSIKKGLLYWVISAKRTETKQKRIAEIVEAALKGALPKQFR